MYTNIPNEYFIFVISNTKRSYNEPFRIQQLENALYS